MTKKKDIIRVGDQVRILRPNIIYKWGYDNNLQDTIDQVLDKHKDKIEKFIISTLKYDIGLSNDIRCSSLSSKSVRRVASGIAYEMVSWRMGDGNIRKLFYKKDLPQDDYRTICLNHQKGQIAEVSKIKIVKTGRYCPPEYSYGDDWYTSSCRYQDYPGGLRDVKTHKLLELNWTDDWIEDCDVEKVHDREKED